MGDNFVTDKELEASEKYLERETRALEKEEEFQQKKKDWKVFLNRTIFSRGKNLVNGNKQKRTILERFGYDPSAEARPGFIETHVKNKNARIFIYIVLIAVSIMFIVFRYTIFK